MFGKSYLMVFVGILLVLSLGLGTVCASDVEVNGTAEYHSLDMDYGNLVDLLKLNNGTINLNNNSCLDDDDISQLNNIGISNCSFILVSGPDFKDLNIKISNANANDIIVFDGNFTQEVNGETIHLDKPLRLMGNNNFLNAQNYTKLFSIESDNILFINLNIINSRDMGLARVSDKFKNVSFIGCNVYNVLDNFTCQSYDFVNNQFVISHKVDINCYEDREKLLEASKTFYDNLIINFEPNGYIYIDSAIYAFIKYNCSNLIINGNGATVRSVKLTPHDITPGSEYGAVHRSVVTNVNQFLINNVNTIIYNLTLECFNGAIINKGTLEVNHVVFKDNACYTGDPENKGDCVCNKGIFTSINSTYKNSHSNAVYCYPKTLFKSINDTFVKSKDKDVFLDDVAVLKFYGVSIITPNVSIEQCSGSMVVYRNSTEDVVKRVIINNQKDLDNLHDLVGDIKHIDVVNVIFNNTGITYWLNTDCDVFLQPLVDLTIDGNNARVQIKSPKDSLENHFIANALFYIDVHINNLYLSGFNTALTNWGQMVLNNCTFHHNRIEYTFKEDYGGAIRNWGYLVINSCIFSDNHAKFGGAIYNSGNLLLMGNNIFIGNYAYYDTQNLFSKIFSSKSTDKSSANIFNEGVLKEFNSNCTIDDIYNDIKDKWNWRTILFQVVIPMVFVPLGITLSFVPLTSGIGWAILGLSMDVFIFSLTSYNFASTLISYFSYKSLGGEVNDGDNIYLKEILPTLIYDGILMTIGALGIMAKVSVIYKYQKLLTQQKMFKSAFEATRGVDIYKDGTSDMEKVVSHTRDLIKKLTNYYTCLYETNNEYDLLCDGSPVRFLQIENEFKDLLTYDLYLSTHFDFKNPLFIENFEVMTEQLVEIQSQVELYTISMNNGINSKLLQYPGALKLYSFISFYKFADVSKFIFSDPIYIPTTQMSYGEHLDMVIPVK